jgi:hypothetical protein
MQGLRIKEFKKKDVRKLLRTSFFDSKIHTNKFYPIDLNSKSYFELLYQIRIIYR